MKRGQVKEAGFTFVELMVVIFIIGLAATAVILAIPDEGGSVQAEADRFAARAKTLRDRAIVESRAAAIRIDANGYILTTRNSGDYEEDGRFEWAAGTRTSISRAGETGESGEARFDSTGMATPMIILLARGQRQVAVEIGHDGSVHVRR